MSTSTNYFVRHWRGELSLAKSFWLNYALVNVVIFVILAVLGEAAKQGAVPPDRVPLALIPSPVIIIWQAVGCWRAANNHRKSTGRWGAAVAASLFVLISSIFRLVWVGQALMILTAENPLAFDTPQRQEFVRSFVGECVKSLPALPREQAVKSCSCMATAVADTATTSELRTVKPDDSAVRTRLTAARAKCT